MRSSARARLGGTRTGIISEYISAHVSPSAGQHYPSAACDITPSLQFTCTRPNSSLDVVLSLHNYHLLKSTGHGAGYLAPPPTNSFGRSSSAHDLVHAVSRSYLRPSQRSGSQQTVGNFGSLRKFVSMTRLHLRSCSSVAACNDCLAALSFQHEEQAAMLAQTGNSG